MSQGEVYIHSRGVGLTALSLRTQVDRMMNDFGGVAGDC